MMTIFRSELQADIHYTCYPEKISKSLLDPQKKGNAINCLEVLPPIRPMTKTRPYHLEYPLTSVIIRIGHWYLYYNVMCSILKKLFHILQKLLQNCL